MVRPDFLPMDLWGVTMPGARANRGKSNRGKTNRGKTNQEMEP